MKIIKLFKLENKLEFWYYKIDRLYMIPAVKINENRSKFEI